MLSTVITRYGPEAGAGWHQRLEAISKVANRTAIRRVIWALAIKTEATL